MSKKLSKKYKMLANIEPGTLAAHAALAAPPIIFSLAGYFGPVLYNYISTLPTTLTSYVNSYGKTGTELANVAETIAESPRSFLEKENPIKAEIIELTGRLKHPDQLNQERDQFLIEINLKGIGNLKKVGALHGTGVGTASLEMVGAISEDLYQLKATIRNETKDVVAFRYPGEDFGQYLTSAQTWDNAAQHIYNNNDAIVGYQTDVTTGTVYYVFESFGIALSQVDLTNSETLRTIFTAVQTAHDNGQNGFATMRMVDGQVLPIQHPSTEVAKRLFEKNGGNLTESSIQVSTNLADFQSVAEEVMAQCISRNGKSYVENVFMDQGVCPLENLYEANVTILNKCELDEKMRETMMALLHPNTLQAESFRFENQLALTIPSETPDYYAEIAAIGLIFILYKTFSKKDGNANAVKQIVRNAKRIKNIDPVQLEEVVPDVLYESVMNKLGLTYEKKKHNPITKRTGWNKLMKGIAIAAALAAVGYTLSNIDISSFTRVCETRPLALLNLENVSISNVSSLGQVFRPLLANPVVPSLLAASPLAASSVDPAAASPLVDSSVDPAAISSVDPAAISLSADPLADSPSTISSLADPPAISDLSTDSLPLQSTSIASVIKSAASSIVDVTASIIQGTASAASSFLTVMNNPLTMDQTLEEITRKVASTVTTATSPYLLANQMSEPIRQLQEALTSLQKIIDGHPHLTPELKNELYSTIVNAMRDKMPSSELLDKLSKSDDTVVEAIERSINNDPYITLFILAAVFSMRQFLRSLFKKLGQSLNAIELSPIREFHRVHPDISYDMVNHSLDGGLDKMLEPGEQAMIKEVLGVEPSTPSEPVPFVPPKPSAPPEPVVPESSTPSASVPLESSTPSAPSEPVPFVPPKPSAPLYKFSANEDIRKMSYAYLASSLVLPLTQSLLQLSKTKGYPIYIIDNVFAVTKYRTGDGKDIYYSKQIDTIGDLLKKYRNVTLYDENDKKMSNLDVLPEKAAYYYQKEYPVGVALTVFDDHGRCQTYQTVPKMEELGSDVFDEEGRKQTKISSSYLFITTNERNLARNIFLHRILLPYLVTKDTATFQNRLGKLYQRFSSVQDIESLVKTISMQYVYREEELERLLTVWKEIKKSPLPSFPKLYSKKSTPTFSNAYQTNRSPTIESILQSALKKDVTPKESPTLLSPRKPRIKKTTGKIRTVLKRVKKVKKSSQRVKKIKKSSQRGKKSSKRGKKSKKSSRRVKKSSKRGKKSKKSSRRGKKSSKRVKKSKKSSKRGKKSSKRVKKVLKRTNRSRK